MPFCPSDICTTIHSLTRRSSLFGAVIFQGLRQMRSKCWGPRVTVEWLMKIPVSTRGSGECFHSETRTLAKSNHASPEHVILCSVEEAQFTEEVLWKKA